jgi:GMP synthase (glutamine-hydrolysing)
MTPFVTHLLKHDFPTFGICFGHQLIGYILGTKVVHDSKQAKTGSYDVRLNDMATKERLYKDIPKTFKAQYAHKDTLKKLPNGAVLLAQGRKCNIAAFRYKTNIYCVQFHPELSIDDMMFRMKLFREYVPDSIEKTFRRFKPTTISEKLLSNFITYVAHPIKHFKQEVQVR